ncbi:MAG: DUF2029 domain-containing protein [Bacteroidia bacterium]|nr:DUF2029 domain-containing protein [Bacteroidia bacterium]
MHIGQRFNPDTDFWHFWNAGYNFFQGNSIYLDDTGHRVFSYPPFCAMLLQPLGWFSLNTAGSIFCFINLCILILSFHLCMKILELNDVEKSKAKKAVMLGLLCAGGFYWMNLIKAQMNQVTFIFCVLGIYFHYKKKENLSIGAFAIGAFVKVTPIFFLIWLALRGNWKTYLKIGLAIIIGITIPFLFRGIEQGLLDLEVYYNRFLTPYQEGFVITRHHNQNLASAIYRLCLPSDHQIPFDVQLFNFSEQTARMIYVVSAAILLIAFLVNTIRLNLQKKEISIFEFVSVFTIAHLISGMTWKAHLVSMLFIYGVLFSINHKQLTRTNKITLYLIFFIIIAIALSGRDIISKHFYYFIEGYSFITWTLLSLFIYSIWATISFPKLSRRIDHEN